MSKSRAMPRKRGRDEKKEEKELRRERGAIDHRGTCGRWEPVKNENHIRLRAHPHTQTHTTLLRSIVQVDWVRKKQTFKNGETNFSPHHI